MHQTRATVGPIVVSMLLLGVVGVVGAGGYGGGYLLRSDVQDYPAGCFNPPYTERVFPTQWEADFFQPAASVESLVVGKPVMTAPIVPLD